MIPVVSSLGQPIVTGEAIHACHRPSGSGPIAAQFNGQSELISEETHQDWPLWCHTLQLIALPNRIVSVSAHLLWNPFNVNKWSCRQEPAILPSSFIRCSPEPDLCPPPLSGPTKEPEQSQSLHSHSSSAHRLCRKDCPPKFGPVLWAWHMWNQRQDTGPVAPVLGMWTAQTYKVRFPYPRGHQNSMWCTKLGWDVTRIVGKLQVRQNWVDYFIRQYYAVVWERGDSLTKREVACIQ